MSLILRLACSQSNPQRAEEARQLLRTTPGPASSLIQRIALSNGNSWRAEAARDLLKTMRERSTPKYPLPLLHRIAAGSDDAVPARAKEVF